MDISGWTVDQRMRFPDWCFGNRKVIGVSGTATGVGVFYWVAAFIVMPDPVCLWAVNIFPRKVSSTNDYIRVGFRASKPTSEAQMDESIPIFPNFPHPAHQPPRIFMSESGLEVWRFDVRKGMVTGGFKLVMEVHSATVKTSILFSLVYSELPTNMAGWMAHNKV